MPPDRSCTITEVDTGGATSVTYSCSIFYAGDNPATTGADCRGDNGAEFGDVVGANAIITVTNTFAARSAPALDEPAPAVQTPPRFTG